MTITVQPTMIFAAQVAQAERVVDAATTYDARNERGHVRTGAFKAMFKALSNINTQQYRYDAADEATVGRLQRIEASLAALRPAHRLHKSTLFASKFERVENLQTLFRQKLSGALGKPASERPSPVHLAELMKLRHAMGPVTSSDLFSAHLLMGLRSPIKAHQSS